MRTGRLTAPALVLATVILFTHAVPVGADDGASAFVDAEDRPVVTADDTVVDLTSNGSSAQPSNCVYLVVLEDDMAFGIYDERGNRLYSETGRWLERECDGQRGEPFPEGGPVDPRALALSALAVVSIPNPPMVTSPSADERLYTQLPTWLWIDPDWWQAYSATATAGRVSATVTATPTTARWSMGDGAMVVCDGPGTEWRRGMDDGATDCRHTYRHSSTTQPSGTYVLSVSVTFDITWSSNTGQGGTLDAITRDASRPVEVGEIQALETG